MVHQGARELAAVPARLLFSPEHLSDGVDLKSGLRQEALEPGVLGFQLAQAPHLVYLHGTIAPAPPIESLLADSVATAYVSYARPLGVCFLQDAGDLGLGESRLLHVLGLLFLSWRP
jgi:hypothetical protein